MTDSKEILQRIKDQGDLVRKLKAAKESSDKGQKDLLKSKYNLVELDNYFCLYSYIAKFEPSYHDIKLLNDLASETIDYTKYLYIKRWRDHMHSFTELEQAQFKDTWSPNILQKIFFKSLDDEVSLSNSHT